jgi:hypothetical protein
MCVWSLLLQRTGRGGPGGPGSGSSIYGSSSGAVVSTKSMLLMGKAINASLGGLPLRSRAGTVTTFLCCRTIVIRMYRIVVRSALTAQRFSHRRIRMIRHTLCRYSRC